MFHNNPKLTTKYTHIVSTAINYKLMPKLAKQQILEGLTYRKAALDLITSEGFSENFDYLRTLTRDILVSKLNCHQSTPSFESCEDADGYLIRLEKTLGFAANEWKRNITLLIEFLEELLGTDQFDEMRLGVSEFKGDLRPLTEGTPLPIPSIGPSHSVDIPDLLHPNKDSTIQGGGVKNSPNYKQFQRCSYENHSVNRTLDLDRCYAINEGNKRGLCLIVNIFREFASNDVWDGVRIFEDLNYKVITFDNITAGTYVTSLKNIRKEIESLNSDSFILIFSSHGDPENVLFSDGKRMPRENIILDFLPSYCPFLSGKPKLFFFQNCRGSESYVDSAVSQEMDADIMSDAVHSQNIKIMQSIRTGRDLPTDIMRFYATTQGSVAYRLPTGSIFLQSLYEILRDDSLNRESLNELQSDLVRRVTLYSQEGLEKQNKIGAQVPEFKSSLVKKFYFKHPYL